MAYIQKHYQRKHPAINFASDFKPASKPPQPAAPDHKLIQEQMMARVRKELEQQLQDNLTKVQQQV
jgi:hypothetical protein